MPHCACDDPGRENSADDVSDAGYQADEGVDAESEARSRNGERLVHQSRELTQRAQVRGKLLVRLDDFRDENFLSHSQPLCKPSPISEEPRERARARERGGRLLARSKAPINQTGARFAFILASEWIAARRCRRGGRSRCHG